MKKSVLLFLFAATSLFAQKQINNYKYIIVPNQFDFVNKTDKYQTSSLTKFLFNKYGFTAFLADEKLPNDLAKNRCLALTGNVRDDSGMFMTKSIVEMKDCNNTIVFTSKEGKSRKKEYKKAYHEAIRNAFKSIQSLNYKYSLTEKEAEITLTTTPKIVVEDEQERTKSTSITKTPQKDEVKKILNILYAQPKDNGYQLVNTKPEVVYELLNTNKKDIYILKKRKGVLYKNNNKWIVEYYQNGTKTAEAVNVKF